MRRLGFTADKGNAFTQDKSKAFFLGKVGFTLIELLVVIAIISLLAAILFPVFAQAREKGRQSTCQSNLRQIGIAIHLYAEDFDGTYVPKYNCITYSSTYPDHCASPELSTNGAITPALPTWLPAPSAPAGTPYLLEPYIKNDGIRSCPSHQVYAPLAGDTVPAEGRYVINGWDSYFARTMGYTETSPQGRPDAEVDAPSETLIVWEHNNSANECQNGQEGGDKEHPALSSDNHWSSDHQGGFNALYCDGHVKRLQFSQLRRRMFTIQKD